MPSFYVSNNEIDNNLILITVVRSVGLHSSLMPSRRVFALQMQVAGDWIPKSRKKPEALKAHFVWKVSRERVNFYSDLNRMVIMELRSIIFKMFW